MRRSPRIAVVSPFLDKRHGTERVVSEQIERLARDFGWEVHIYSQRVEDLRGVLLSNREQSSAKSQGSRQVPDAPPNSRDEGRLIWHRIPTVPGPHLFNYAWWFFANHLWRRWARWFRGVRYDLVYSPGINCLDADAIAVHIVFHEFKHHVGGKLKLSKVPLRAWPRALHRRTYYGLIRALERRIYPQQRIRLAAVSGLTARDLERHFGRRDVIVIPNAIDLEKFNPRLRAERRFAARCRLGFEESDFVLLLIGNDWKAKGLDFLLEAAALCRNAAVRVLIVGRDDRAPYFRTIKRLGLGESVRFAEPAFDVIEFYAAADAFVGPSLHDSFALPPAEAMACGLPVVTSRNNGGCEMISDGDDGFVLDDPADVERISRIIGQLHADVELRRRIGEKAARTVQMYTWHHNVDQMRQLLEEALEAKAARG